MLALDAGSHPSLTVTAGDGTRAASSNLTVDQSGAFVLAPAHGLAGLGTIERFLIAGTGTLPSTDTILGPNLVARDNDSLGSGTFLRAGAGNELLPAIYTESASVPIASVLATAIYDVTTDQTIASSATAKVAALRVNGATVGGGAGTVLDVGPNAAQQGAGVILNHGIISAGILRFGASDGYIYASLGASGDARTAGGRIDSEITGSGALTTHGPGVLELTANNSLHRHDIRPERDSAGRKSHWLGHGYWQC